MRIVPDSTVTLYSGVEIDNGEQLCFSSKAHQTSYFQNRLVQQSVPCTIVRKTGALRLEVAGSVVSACNYLSFINPSFDNKIVYARIMDYDYINNECVEIAYAIDYWQTWMFDVQFESMYIEREHLSEADWTKAESNPYDPTIFEFKTNENLPVSKDLEKLTYSISSSSGADGLKLAAGSHSITGATSKLGVLIKLADINFKAADDAWIDAWKKDHPSTPFDYQDLPSFPFMRYLVSISNQSYGFYYITSTILNYFNSRYTGTGAQYWPAANRYRQKFGAGWGTLRPFAETRFTPSINYIYDAEGATGDSLMGTLLGALLPLTTEGTLMDNTLIDTSIIPNDMMTLGGSVNGSYPLRAGTSPAQPIQVSSKKLMRFPFCYARIIAPNGDIKELQYEKFENIQMGQDQVAWVYVTMDLTDAPTLIIAPSRYRYRGMSYQAGYQTNVEDALFFSQFPTMPMNIDAFTAQVAAQANTAIANRTIDAAYEMTKADLQDVSDLGVASKQHQAALSGVRNTLQSLFADVPILGLYSSAMSFGVGSTLVDLTKQQTEAKERMWNQAPTALSDIGGSEVANQLRLTKAAYAADHYYPSNGIGAVNYNYLAYCDVILLNVSLNEDIVRVYDNYFKMYGYTSGRCGIPRVCNYVAGESTNTEVPHWESVDNKYVTYIKTMDCKLKHSMIPVAESIKAMFDSGVRMIKGD